MYKSIYIPKDINEAIQIAQLLDNNNAQDLVRCHAAFGHHFNGDIGLNSNSKLLSARQAKP